MKKFENTILALVEYDRTAPAREEMFANLGKQDGYVACQAAFDEWEAAEKDALKKVQVAFHQDTSEYNHLDNCLRCDIHFMRKVACKSRVKDTE